MFNLQADHSSTVPFSLSQRAGWASGAAIGKLMAQAIAHPDLLSLAAGFVDNATLPCEAVQASFERLASDSQLLTAALQYDSSSGNLELRRELVAQYPDEYRPDPESLVLTAGSNQMLHLLAETLFNPGDIVLCAAPTYFVFLGTLRGVGARAVAVESDEQGMCMEDLSAQLERLDRAGLGSRVKAIYCVTEFDNPAGSTLSLDRRHKLLDIARKWNVDSDSPLLVLGDSAYRELYFENPSHPPLVSLDRDAADFVVDLGTFSKSFSPGIRVGWGVLPEWLVAPVLEMKSNVDFGSPHFSQLLILKALQSGLWEKHLPTIRNAYQEKCKAMLNALKENFEQTADVTWRIPHGGLYVWLTLPEHVDTSEGGTLWNAAVEEGVLYVPGHHCFPNCDGEGQETQVPKNSIRLSYGVQDKSGIELGIQKLAQAVRAVN